MVRLSNLADYAVVVMMHAARSADFRVRASDIASGTGIPLPTVAKIMGLLSRGGLLVSHRGAGGGFELALPAAQVSVAQVVEAVDGPIALTQCVEHQSGDCGLHTTCQMRPHWPMINAAVREALDAVSLASLITPVTGALDHLAAQVQPDRHIAHATQQGQ